MIKNADVVSGLSDLPWHRDCGMGGHPVLCPSLLIGIQLDVASAANGQLVFLAGSHHHTNRIGSVEEHPEWPTVAVDARPGDVTVHYSHVLHTAPPPTAADAHRRTLYVSFNNPAVFDVVPPGQATTTWSSSHGDGHGEVPRRDQLTSGIGGGHQPPGAVELHDTVDQMGAQTPSGPRRAPPPSRQGRACAPTVRVPCARLVVLRIITSRSSTPSLPCIP